jgi:hypothetical protein
MRDGMITGEGLSTVRVVADLDGKFTLITSEWPGTITASPLIRNGMGAVDLVVSKPPIVIVVR